MRTITVALATALLLWAGVLLQAQSVQQLLTGLSRADTAATADSFHTKKAAAKKYHFQSAATSLGHPAGQKLAGRSKRETDSLQQIILLRKKF